jgi:hypothetical protein
VHLDRRTWTKAVDQINLMESTRHSTPVTQGWATRNAQHARQIRVRAASEKLHGKISSFSV